MITEAMIEACMNAPVTSRSHEWDENEHSQYNSMKHRGRSMYDQLRTQFDVDHDVAYVWCATTFGTKR